MEQTRECLLTQLTAQAILETEKRGVFCSDDLSSSEWTNSLFAKITYMLRCSDRLMKHQFVSKTTTLAVVRKALSTLFFN